MKGCLPLAVLGLLTACRSPEYARADNRILWDAQGCAFHVEPGIRSTSLVKSLPDADKPTCPTQEAQHDD